MISHIHRNHYANSFRPFEVYPSISISIRHPAFYIMLCRRRACRLSQIENRLAGFRCSRLFFVFPLSLSLSLFLSEMQPLKIATSCNPLPDLTKFDLNLFRVLGCIVRYSTSRNNGQASQPCKAESGHHKATAEATHRGQKTEARTNQTA